MNILTFDVEEWFYRGAEDPILDNDYARKEKEWEQYESRIHSNMDRIFEALDETGTKATFFCLGWIARKYPEIVKAIVDRGYEVGTHTDMHQRVYWQTPEVYAEDIERSIKTIEDAGGKKVRCFRAPFFSMCDSTLWAFDILANFGITIDSSIFPANHSYGSFLSYDVRVPAFIQHNGIRFKEFPLTYANVLGKPVAFGGGGYFRCLPYFLIKKWSRSIPYMMAYFHPRDFDAGQPVFKDISLRARFRGYVGLGGAYDKFKKFLRDFEFVDIDGADKMIDWEKARVINSIDKL